MSVDMLDIDLATEEGRGLLAALDRTHGGTIAGVRGNGMLLHYCRNRGFNRCFFGCGLFDFIETNSP